MIQLYHANGAVYPVGRPARADDALVVRYEDLCTSPNELVRRTLDHCRLTPGESVIDVFSARLSAPDYYSVSFSDGELAVIHEETAATAARFGYDVRAGR